MTYKLGSECIKKYTGIDGSLAKKVLLEGKKINALLDEILEKMDSSEHRVQKILLNEEKLPEKLKKQLALGLPLGEKQLKQALKEQPKWRREAKEVLENLSDQQLDYLGDLNEGDRYSVIVTLKSGERLFNLESLKDLDLSLVAHQSPDKLKVVHGEVTPPKVDPVKATRSIIQDEAIGVIGNKLSKEQRQFWRSKLSFNQRKEIAVHMLNDMYSLDQEAIDLSLLKPRLREQIRLGFALTKKQWATLGLPLQEEI